MFFVRYKAECDYQLDFRTKDEEKPLIVATIYHPSQHMNPNKIIKFEKDGYRLYKIDKVTIFTFNSIKKLNLRIYKKYVPKPFLLTKILQMNDKDPDNFEKCGCKINFWNFHAIVKMIMFFLDMFVIYYIQKPSSTCKCISSINFNIIV